MSETKTLKQAIDTHQENLIQDDDIAACVANIINIIETEDTLESTKHTPATLTGGSVWVAQHTFAAGDPTTYITAQKMCNTLDITIADLRDADRRIRDLLAVHAT